MVGFLTIAIYIIKKDLLVEGTDKIGNYSWNQITKKLSINHIDIMRNTEKLFSKNGIWKMTLNIPYIFVNIYQ